eukprot:EG_transcript_15873
MAHSWKRSRGVCSHEDSVCDGRCLQDPGEHLLPTGGALTGLSDGSRREPVPRRSGGPASRGGSVGLPGGSGNKPEVLGGDEGVQQGSCRPTFPLGKVWCPRASNNKVGEGCFPRWSRGRAKGWILLGHQRPLCVGWA